MKKITEQTVNAFHSKQSKTLGNTRAGYNKQLDSIALYLHNNKIAELDNNNLYITNAGRKTSTTKERLNGILDKYQMFIKQTNFVWYLVDRETQEQVEFKKGNKIKNVKIF